FFGPDDYDEVKFGDLDTPDPEGYHPGVGTWVCVLGDGDGKTHVRGFALPNDPVFTGSEDQRRELKVDIDRRTPLDGYSSPGLDPDALAILGFLCESDYFIPLLGEVCPQVEDVR